MKNKLNYALIIAAIVLAGSVVNASSVVRATYPKNFIPFWSQAKRGHEVALLNTQQIVQIRPYFNPDVSEPDHDHILYLDVDLVDGKTIQVFEKFDEFYQRVRVSQAK